MKPEPRGAHRVGRLERGGADRFVRKAAGTSPRIENPQLDQAVVSVLTVLEKWDPQWMAELSDARVIHLERDLEAALAKFIPAGDGRRANGRKPGGGAL